MCFTYEVLETFCNLPILAANPKKCLHRTPHFPMTSQRAHPTAPRSRLFTPLHPCRSMMPGTHRPATPHPCLFATLQLCRSMAPCAYRPRAPYLRHTMLPSPTPLTVPRQVRLAPPSALLQSCRKPGNKKVIKIATYLRLAIAADVQNHGSSPENEAKRPLSASFPLYGRRERAANRKKVAKAPGFLFS